MKRETYKSMMAWFEERPAMTRAVVLANKVITYAIYVAYPCLLVWLAVRGNVLFWRALLVPAISFAIVTIVRKKIDAPRPYEVFGIPSAMHKDTKGKSLPSRHVFSISVIAMTFLACITASPVPGVVLLVLSVVLACVRVVTGVHFVRDVIWGMACGIVAGLVGFWIV